MGTGYTRNDTGNNIADGNVINASDLDGEFDALEDAFDGSTGHSHDGTTGEGPQIDTAGLANDAVTGAKIDSTTTITAASFVGPLTGNVTGDVTGNADTATALETGRTIGGVSFDGTANINLPGVNTTGNQDTTGNAATATALETPRTIAGQSFDGTANISIAPGNLTGVTASAAEINKLDGATVSTAELNILDGATVSTAELNILDGATVTTGELNILDGVTATTAELNILDGVTADAAELNKLDGFGDIGFREIPAVGTKTGSYTLATGDVGKYVQVGSGGSITIPDATFSEGDAIVLFNNTTGDITVTCSITTAYIAGDDTDVASVTLATRGVCNILFISGTVAVLTGNIS